MGLYKKVDLRCKKCTGEAAKKVWQSASALESYAHSLTTPRTARADHGLQAPALSRPPIRPMRRLPDRSEREQRNEGQALQARVDPIVRRRPRAPFCVILCSLVFMQPCV